MWAKAQPDGRPAEHRWRPLFNAAYTNKTRMWANAQRDGRPAEYR